MSKYVTLFEQVADLKSELACMKTAYQASVDEREKMYWLLEGLKRRNETQAESIGRYQKDLERLPEFEAAVRTLDHLAYRWNGGELWKPPIGKAPWSDFTRYATVVRGVDVVTANMEPHAQGMWVRYDQAIAVTRYHIDQLNALAERYKDVPEPAKPPEGWAFAKADFRDFAKGCAESGVVTLIRTHNDRMAWLKLSDEDKTRYPIHVEGYGRTLDEAIRNAAQRAISQPLPAPPKIKE